MMLVRKTIAYCLLLAFVAVLTPWPVLHDSIAGHSATEHTACAEHHQNMPSHIEEGHAHCSFFDTKSIVYNTTEFTADIQLLLQFETVYNTAIKPSQSQGLAINLPSRAPPAC
ncbi:MAG: hypothetical protein M0D57_11945 [Sphingobacteriales bacterium JAD_PAG50586_3]|nr:MAG: hypothetical protein M0D57_11945 [Sphingobacteriales bacterium JAD_PAG50586_3]